MGCEREDDDGEDVLAHASRIIVAADAWRGASDVATRAGRLSRREPVASAAGSRPSLASLDDVLDDAHQLLAHRPALTQRGQRLPDPLGPSALDCRHRRDAPRRRVAQAGLDRGQLRDVFEKAAWRSNCSRSRVRGRTRE
jgi:hypothetical protein